MRRKRKLMAAQKEAAAERRAKVRPMLKRIAREPVTDNRSRAKRAEETVLSHADEDYSIDYAITDLLVDLRHLCDFKGLSFVDHDRTAHDHYTEEVVEERHAGGAV